MSEIICPHCQSTELGSTEIPKVPKGVVAVIPCPSCSELVVRFKHKMIALNKEILYNGTKDERKMHLADVIAEFMEEGIVNIEMFQSPQFNPEDIARPIDDATEVEIEDVELVENQQITDDELKRFIDFDLDKLDNIDYFRKNFE
jgi:hypothetical protein